MLSDESRHKISPNWRAPSPMASDHGVFGMAEALWEPDRTGNILYLGPRLGLLGKENGNLLAAVTQILCASHSLLRKPACRSLSIKR